MIRFYKALFAGALLIALVIPAPRLGVNYGWPDIRGSAHFQRVIADSLIFLANHDLDDFKAVVGPGGIVIIQEDQAADWHIFVAIPGCAAHVSDGAVDWPYDNVYWLAAEFVHEQYHCQEYRAGQNPTTHRAEQDADVQMWRALQTMHAPGYMVDYLGRVIANEAAKAAGGK